MVLGYVDLGVLPAYVAAVTLVCLAPGPDMAYVVAVGIGHGRRAAVWGALGITLGVTVYTLAVATGLGRVATSNPELLTGIEAVCAAYLLWLAWSTVRRTSVLSGDEVGQSTGQFRRGFLVNLANPKMVLFFAAFLPNFLGEGDATPQFLVLGAVFLLVGLVIDTLVGVGAGTVRDRVLDNPRAVRVLTAVSALVYVLLAGFALAQVAA